MNITCIVEGHGEESAVPVLIRRIDQGCVVGHIERIRRARMQLLRPGELEKWVWDAAKKAGADGAIFVLVDSDDDAPETLLKALAARIEAVHPQVPFAVVAAVREFESWFVAGVEGIRGRKDFSSVAEAPHDPESIRGAKEWLSRHMPSQLPYAPTVHQAAFASSFDMSLARLRSPSFDRCYREIERLLTPF